VTVLAELPVPARAWTAVLDSLSSYQAFQTPRWLECVRAVGGYADATRVYRAGDGRQLVLPLVRRGSRSASLPTGWGIGGLLAEGGPVTEADVELVGADLARLGGLGVVVRPDPAQAATWAAALPGSVRRESRMAQSVPLDGGFDAVWRRFRGDARNRARRAERAGVVVECDDNGRLVPLFHELYAASVARWARRDGIPLPLARWLSARREPPAKLATVAGRMATRCRVYAARVGGRPVAAIVVLVGGRTVSYWRGAMEETTARPTYATYLLHRAAIKDAADDGCIAYHMGDSAPGSPLALFKSRFGAVEQHYASYRFEPVAVGRLAGGGRRLLHLAARTRRGRS